MEDSWWKEILDANTTFLQTNLLLTEILFGHLIEKKIFADHIVQKIKDEEATMEAKVLNLISFLKKRDETSFNRFLLVLDETGHRHVRKRLEKRTSKIDFNVFGSEEHTDRPTELLLEMKDDCIRRLEEIIAQKDRRIKELEEVTKEHKHQAESTLEMLEEEMQTSQMYQERCKQLVQEFRISNDKEQTARQQVNDKELEMADMSKLLQGLERDNQSLTQRLDSITKELETKKEELRNAVQREILLKRKLKLPDEATEGDITNRIQKLAKDSSDLVKGRSELGKMEKELSELNQMKLKLTETITTLTHENDKLQLDLRQNKSRLMQLNRNKFVDFAVFGTALPLDSLPRRKTEPLLHLNLPHLETALLAPTNKSSDRKSAMARGFGGQYNPKSEKALPLSVIRKKEETKYCVLCKKSHLKDECWIHVESSRNGRYSCCGEDAKTKGGKGCKRVNHLYINFAGTGYDYYIYDDQDRRLDFKLQL